MRKSFHIRSEADVSSKECILLLEAGERSVSFGLLEQTTRKLTELGYYECERNESEPLEKLFSLHPHLDQEHLKTAISYLAPEVVLVPENHFREDQADTHMELLYGPAADRSTFSENIPGQDINLVYRLPARTIDFIDQQVKDNKPFHHFTVALNKGDNSYLPVMFADFRTDEFSLVVLDQTGLLLVQFFTYSTPEDVLYHLLKAVKQLSLSQQDTRLVLSGWIDNNSTLTRELLKYFLHIEFETLPAGISLSDVFKEFPAHYFSPMCKLAACVS